MVFNNQKQNILHFDSCSYIAEDALRSQEMFLNSNRCIYIPADAFTSKWLPLYSNICLYTPINVFKFQQMCNVTALAPKHITSSFSNLFTSWPAGDQLVVPRGVTHISCHYKNTIGGTGENKTNEQTRTMLGVNSEQESMQHYISDGIYGLTLAWITGENSTKQLECRHLDSIFFAGPYLLCYCLTAPVSGVDCPCPWFHANSPISFLQPTLFSRPVTSSGHAEISSPKTLWLVSRQNRQRNRLLGGPPI